MLLPKSGSTIGLSASSTRASVRGAAMFLLKNARRSLVAPRSSPRRALARGRGDYPARGGSRVVGRLGLLDRGGLAGERRLRAALPGAVDRVGRAPQRRARLVLVPEPGRRGDPALLRDPSPRPDLRARLSAERLHLRSAISISAARRIDDQLEHVAVRIANPSGRGAASVSSTSPRALGRSGVFA